MAESRIGDNSEITLTDEQQQALFVHHKRLYVDSLAKKKEADAAFKNTCKAAKSEGVSADMIKFALQLEGDEDGKLEQERIEKERIARWFGLNYGEQALLLDRTPGEDRAENEGFIAGSAGKSRNSPYAGILESSWLSGWTRGQQSLMSGLSLFKSREDPEGEGVEGALEVGSEFDEDLD